MGLAARGFHQITILSRFPDRSSHGILEIAQRLAAAAEFPLAAMLDSSLQMSLFFPFHGRPPVFPF
jgi:hypothetical protein